MAEQEEEQAPRVLENFEGEPVVGHRVDLYSRRDAIDGRYHRGEQCVVVIVGTVDKILHEKQAQGLLRVHKVSPDLIERLEGTEATEWVERLRRREIERKVETGEIPQAASLPLEGEPPADDEGGDLPLTDPPEPTDAPPNLGDEE